MRRLLAMFAAFFVFAVLGAIPLGKGFYRLMDTDNFFSRFAIEIWEPLGTAPISFWYLISLLISLSVGLVIYIAVGMIMDNHYLKTILRKRPQR